MLTGRDLAAILGTPGLSTLDALTDFVYSQCYTKAFSEPTPERPPTGDLTPLLRAAHAGQACREFGWRVDQILDSGRVLARKGAEARCFVGGQYLNLESPFIVKKDFRIAICLPKDSSTIQSSYYHFFGDAIGAEDEGSQLLRFYWNVTADGAPLLVTLVTRAFGRFQIPYQMKLLEARQAYIRRDAGVLYVNRRYYRIVAMILAGIHPEIAAYLGDGTPLFTKRLERGLGFAENPGESFGKSRSRIVAQALWKAREQGLSGEAELSVALIREFRECGLNTDLPYLNPGSCDEYEWP